MMNNTPPRFGLFLRRTPRAWWLTLLLVTGGAVAAEAAPFAYVANNGSATVSVIDTVSNTVVATVPVGSAPYGVAITPDGAAYVANSASATVSVIDTASNTVVATVPVGTSPRWVAITPNGAFAYVTNSAFTIISVIDTARNTVVATVPVGIAPEGAAITPNSGVVDVTKSGFTIVSLIDTAGKTVATVPVGSAPYGVALTPAGTVTYVANSASNTISAIHKASSTVLATVPVGTTPVWVAITPDGEADTMSWEMVGRLISADGVFADYLAPDTPVTLTLFGDPDQPAFIPPRCPPESESANFMLSGAELQVGDFTYTVPSGVIERNNESGSCGSVGAPLDLMSFNWMFVGDPPDPRLQSLRQVYSSLEPVDVGAITLGQQLDAVHDVPFGLAAGFPRSGGFVFTGEFVPVPEPPPHHRHKKGRQKM